MHKILVVCTTDSMIWNFLVPHIKELEKRGYYVECACYKTGIFYSELEKQYDIKLNELHCSRSPIKLNNIEAAGELKKIIKQKKFDTVFCHEPVGGVLGRIVGHKYKCKVIYMVHGFHFFTNAPLINWMIFYNVEKILAKFTDLLITINDEDYRRACKFKTRRAIKVNGVGIDTKKFTSNIATNVELRNEYNIPKEAYVLLSVGELSTRKNHITIIKALKKLNNKNIFYFIAGDGEKKGVLFRLIKKLGLEKNVIMLGYRTDISRLCNFADIFIMPSLQEGLSVALMEAMGCEKPVIASKIRGNVDLIVEGSGGYLSPCMDVDSYANSIEKLVDSKELREKFGKFNKEYIEKFDVNSIKKELCDEIEFTINNVN